MLAFGLPRDAVAWVALCLGLLILVLPRLALPARPLLWLSGAAAALSLGYFYYYLGGAPRVIDATTYLLEARSFADASVGFVAPDPTASFRGRFLIHTAQDPSLLAGIFPPGYPALLSLGVLAGHYEWVGPLIAAALVVVTYHLGLILTRRKAPALLAASFSVVCACLRYHHAETMSHGWAGLLTATALLATANLVRGRKTRQWPLALGLSLGLLIATRQLTGVVVAFSCLGGLLFRLKGPSRKLLLPHLSLVAIALLPGLFLLLLHQYAITGEVFGSPQLRYYQFADGPEGCFGLGLGKGCHYEHADVIMQQGGSGLTLGWALRNTLHRLHWHSLDIANFELLFLVALFYAFKVRRRPHYLSLLLTLIALPLAYSAFYFNGSYPGGGARLFSELLPLWHVLLASGLCALHATRVGLSTALLGFALHASFSHQALASPSFGPRDPSLLGLPQLLKEESSRRKLPPLIFVPSAHQFNLGWHSDPRYTLARRTHDDREKLLIAHLGYPRAYALTNASTGLELEELPPGVMNPKTGTTYGLEAEFDYPPLFLRSLWVHPEYLSLSCVSKGRALSIHQQNDQSAISLESAGVPPGIYELELQVVVSGSKCEFRSLGRRRLPSPILLEAPELDSVTHIDRLNLTFVHP